VAVGAWMLLLYNGNGHLLNMQLFEDGIESVINARLTIDLIIRIYVRLFVIFGWADVWGMVWMFTGNGLRPVSLRGCSVLYR
jgi:hypothetical protein